MRPGCLRRWRTWYFMAVLVVLARPGATEQTSSIPHVDECNTCMRCQLEAAPPPHTAATTGRSLQTSTNLADTARVSPYSHMRVPHGSSGHMRPHEHYHHWEEHHHGTHRHLTMLPHQGAAMAARNAWASAWAARNATAHSSPAENTHANDGSTPPDWTDWPQELPRLLSVSHLTQPGSVGALLRPDPAVEAARRLKPNCTVCRGCNVELQKLSSTEVAFGPRLRFTHGKGASAGWIFFGRPAACSHRFIVKVFCLPMRKAKAKRTGQAGAREKGAGQQCGVHTYESRLRLVFAQQALVGECGMEGITPKVWLAPLRAVVPGTGYVVYWHALWQEQAAGITLHALAQAGVDSLAADLLMNRMNKSQVVLGAVYDVLTAQCDRHAENVFVGVDGRVQLIDNDKALGVVPRCGYDTMLVPGTRYHSVMRVGFWNHLANWYRAREHQGVCRGPVDPRVVVDYRCWVGRAGGDPLSGWVTTSQLPPAAASSQPQGDNTDQQAGATGGNGAAGMAGAGAEVNSDGRGGGGKEWRGGELGARYPAPLAACMRRLAGSSEADIMARYGLTNPLPASVLRNRSRDLLEHGFEWTMAHGLPRNGPRFTIKPQPACCGLTLERGNRVTCAHCWRPHFYSNTSAAGAGIMR